MPPSKRFPKVVTAVLVLAFVLAWIRNQAVLKAAAVQPQAASRVLTTKAHAAPPAESLRLAEASPPAQHASKPKAQFGREKPVEKDKKPDGEKP